MTLTSNLAWAGSTFKSRCTGFAPFSFSVAVLGAGAPPTPLPLQFLFPQGLLNCNLLASPHVTDVTFPFGGESDYSFSIPNNPIFAGAELSHQFVQIEMNALGFASFSSSNGLALTVGVL